MISAGRVRPCASFAAAMPSAAEMPPHMTRQCPLAAKPSSNAAPSVSAPFIAAASRCLVGVVERQQPRSIQVVELIVIDRPEEHPHRACQEQQRQRDQQQQDVHAAAARGEGSRGQLLRDVVRARRTPRPMRSAFRMTPSELSDMPSAASHGGTKPSAASGTAARL